jgi:hypothetical protein
LKEVAESEGKTLPPTGFRTITDAGVMNFNRRIVEFSHLWCFSGSKWDWIAEAMQKPSKRSMPDFFEQKGFSGVRWRRKD